MLWPSDSLQSSFEPTNRKKSLKKKQTARKEIKTIVFYRFIAAFNQESVEILLTHLGALARVIPGRIRPHWSSNRPFWQLSALFWPHLRRTRLIFFASVEDCANQPESTSSISDKIEAKPYWPPRAHFVDLMKFEF
jgi:hypothetical protein